MLTMLKQMSVLQVAKQVGEHDTGLWRLLTGFVRDALELQDFSVDEYSHKGHDYIAVFLAHPKKFKEKKGNPDDR